MLGDLGIAAPLALGKPSPSSSSSPADSTSPGFTKPRSMASRP
ncbi:hypothetical protein J2Z31_005194 [Sinorhizobium kostiense]|uniref:Uncharacterized protein n=1 Tax=Sinorhizobium kostiense TaxID=76747 RepID=A0ABS4R6Z8_9HYPH|nr:hypothetical protein [Sinorhizobium kostiense]MBP2238653.1 hypothetical protein [Sinorhizobium kostiense]